MDPAHLRDVLSRHDADPDVVLTQLRVKQRARRRRQTIFAVTAGVMLVAGGVGIWSRLGEAPGTTSSTAAESPTTADAGLAANACLALPESLSRARSEGVSVIVARGKLTGRTRIDGYRYHEVTLSHVRTLTGPAVGEGATVWTQAASGSADAGPEGPLWGPDGALLGFYAPQNVNRGSLGAVVSHVPVVGNSAILAADGCWNSFTAAGLQGVPYHGPLTGAPGSDTYTRLQQRGLVAIPLDTIEKLTPP
ncbi:hypothetical protein BJY16_002998 [Actinoplanes octamycinicus]|uniref:Uncharacterized protein n=1 Tax=Actinoplanes octamycinicus TaxID=135948 RepID=A0A7W7GWE3_9ACTN|nr:hypothetical protein [Actinoplanes octamycinicus]MBB4739539.1 hypothetical protein [Actinoplanes octamycinicus]GIE54721.1 hypothetical protein Aoc01nite_01230 [Actinoplanes octamycinicus]